MAARFVKDCEKKDHSENEFTSGGHGDWEVREVPKTCQKQAAADPRGFCACVCANTFVRSGGTAGDEGRSYVLLCYCPVGVVKTSSKNVEEEPGGV